MSMLCCMEPSAGEVSPRSPRNNSVMFQTKTEVKLEQFVHSGAECSVHSQTDSGHQADDRGRWTVGGRGREGVSD